MVVVGAVALAPPPPASASPPPKPEPRERPRRSCVWWRGGFLAKTLRGTYTTHQRATLTYNTTPPMGTQTTSSAN